MRNISALAVIAFAAPLLGACVADYKLYAEDQFNAPSDLSESCRYQWVAEKSFYRLDDTRHHGWGDARLQGQASLQPYLKQLTAKCAGRPPSTGAQAQVSAHALEYVNWGKRNAMAIPAGLLNLITIGYAPLEMSNHFAVCVEANFPDGPRRAAMAQGTLDAVTNVWGAMESPIHPGGSLRRASREQLLQQLTQQAWHKLWIRGQTLAEGSTCRATLDNPTTMSTHQ